MSTIAQTGSRTLLEQLTLYVDNAFINKLRP